MSLIVFVLFIAIFNSDINLKGYATYPLLTIRFSPRCIEVGGETDSAIR